MEFHRKKEEEERKKRREEMKRKKRMLEACFDGIIEEIEELLEEVCTCLGSQTKCRGYLNNLSMPDIIS